MDPSKALDIKSQDAAKVYSWIANMINACEQETHLAEAAAFGGISAGAAVADVVNAFNRHRANVLYQATLINDAVKRFDHAKAAVWPELCNKLNECITRCAIAGDLVEAALSASAKSPPSM